MTKQTGFDAFFNAVTRSPEFKTAMTKDWSGDLSKSLKEMEGKLEKTSNLALGKMSDFSDNFATKEAIETGESFSSEDIKNIMNEARTEEKEGDQGGQVKAQYFTMTNPETWGFKGIAGMQELKDQLTESFIKPLKFKFLVEGLTSPQPSPLEERELKNSYSPSTPKEKGLGDEVINEKLKLYKALYVAYEKFKINIPTGLMFYGPPGTGKTFITKKLAEELGAGLIKKSAGEFGSSYQHQTSKNIKEFFEQSKIESKKGPIILFLDEIDSLVSTRTEKSDGNKAEEISQFLQEFNNLSEAPNLIVVGATNRPDHLDSAILRTGRFDKKFYIGPPDFLARKELFEIYIKKENRPAENLDYGKLATLTEGYVPADIEGICDEVARDASKNILELANSLESGEFNSSEILANLDNQKITMELLEKAILEMPSSLKMVDMSIYENWAKKIN